MSDAQYDYIKEAFPVWAGKVIEVAKLVEYNRLDRDEKFYMTGYLWGLSESAKALGMLSDADAFVTETIFRTKKEAEANAKA